MQSSDLSSYIYTRKEDLFTKLEDLTSTLTPSENYDYDFRTINLTLIHCLKLVNEIEALEQRQFALDYINEFDL